MKLQHKLTLWFLAIALCVGGVNLVWILRARSTQAHFDQFANQTTPTLIALGQMKAASMRMFKELYHDVLTGSDALNNLSPSVAEQTSKQLSVFEENFEEAHQQYQQWLSVFEGSADAVKRGTYVKLLRRTQDELYEQGQAIILAVRSGNIDQAQLTVRAELPLIEERFLSVIDKAIAQEVLTLKASKEAVEREVDQTTLTSLVGALIVVLVAVALGVFIAGSVANPIIKLSSDILYMGKDLSRRTRVRSNDEIGTLAHALNEMAETLQQTTVSKRYVDRIITSMVDALLVTDPDGIIRSVNQSAEVLLGRNQSELVERPLVNFFPEIKRPNQTNHNTETTCVHAGGDVVPILFSSAPMLNESQQVEGMVCMALDITERKHAEEALKRAYSDLQQAQQQLVQSEKLSALGQFSAGIAHEVKNPLGIVLGGVEFLEQGDSVTAEERDESLSMIRRAAERANTIVQDLLKFSRPSQLSKENIDPRELIEETVELLKHSGSLKKVSLETEFSHGDAQILVDRNQLQQVLLNLMMNAVDAMSPEGEVSAIDKIKAMASRPTGAAKKSAPTATRHSGLLIVRSMAVSGDEPQCIIEVEDNGEGIKPSDLEHLFEPFFTTKRERKGTGLGLSISKTIVESLGGSIEFQSEVGQGTVARITLPRYVSAR